jgi:hypothetical protein
MLNSHSCLWNHRISVSTGHICLSNGLICPLSSYFSLSNFSPLNANDYLRFSSRYLNPSNASDYLCFSNRHFGPSNASEYLCSSNRHLSLSINHSSLLNGLIGLSSSLLNSL